LHFHRFGTALRNRDFCHIKIANYQSRKSSLNWKQLGSFSSYSGIKVGLGLFREIIDLACLVILASILGN
jgi:hypothetical protein